MDKKQLVLDALKPKVKALGFNKRELQGIANIIADNLSPDEETSEDELKAEIDTQINAVIPFLQVGQSQANRIIEAWKRTDVKNDNQTESEEEKEEPTPKKTETDSMTKAMKELLEVVSGLKDEVKTLKGEKIQDKRTLLLESVIKDTGSFGKMAMKQFSRMKFDTDEEFDEFLDEVKSDLKAFNQERADAGLSKLGAPTLPDKESEKEPEPYSEKELEEMAKY